VPDQPDPYLDLKALEDALIADRRALARKRNGTFDAGEAGRTIVEIQTSLEAVRAAMKEELDPGLRS